jgi:hypothetical protein
LAIWREVRPENQGVKAEEQSMTFIDIKDRVERASGKRRFAEVK